MLRTPLNVLRGSFWFIPPVFRDGSGRERRPSACLIPARIDPFHVVKDFAVQSYRGLLNPKGGHVQRMGHGTGTRHRPCVLATCRRVPSQQAEGRSHAGADFFPFVIADRRPKHRPEDPTDDPAQQRSDDVILMFGHCGTDRTRNDDHHHENEYSWCSHLFFVPPYLLPRFFIFFSSPVFSKYLT